MKTIGEILTLSTEFLQKRSIERPRRQVEEILSYALKIPRLELYMQFDRPLIEEELVQIRNALKRRAEGEPVQYIHGSLEFLGCTIHLSRDVLIPRPETEILVDKILKEIGPSSLEIWDLCTGSGCIGIALKKKRPDCHLVLADVSPKALDMARQNATSNQVEVEFFQGDLLAPFQGRKADVVVCNPPYISEKEYSELDREVRDFEPRPALVAGPTGYEFYERLAKELPAYLKPGGKVYFEIGREMGERMKQIFNHPFWKRQELLQDWSSHDRYYKLETE